MVRDVRLLFIGSGSAFRILGVVGLLEEAVAWFLFIFF
jgi:hypothetical protein